MKNSPLLKKEKSKQNIKVNKNDIACKLHQLHHLDLQIKERHDIKYYTNVGECLYEKRCDGFCKKEVRNMLCCKNMQVLVCQKCLLSATTDNNGCTTKKVFVICYICRQQQFDGVNDRKRRRCPKK